MDLDRLDRAVRRILAPQRERQPLRAHRLIGVQHEYRQQGTRLDATERHRTTVGADLE